LPQDGAEKWVPTRGFTLGRLMVVLFALVVAILTPLEAFAVAAPLGSGFVIITLVTNLGTLGLVAAVFLSYEPLRIGVSSAGVTLAFWYGQRTTPWAYVEPRFLGPQLYGLRFALGVPGRLAHVRLAVLTREQTVAVLNHPSAPSWLAPPEARLKWRIVSRS
jgi:hypothetical protein